MGNQTRRCPNGHVIPAEFIICPICHPSSTTKGEGNFHFSSPPTRAEVDFEATRVEELPTTLWDERCIKHGPLAGWLAITGGMLSGEAFRLFEGRNIIGSSSTCDIQIPDEGIETQHLSIRFSSGKWTLTDLDTDGGTSLNGKRIYRTELKDGDHIKIGKADFRIKML